MPTALTNTNICRAGVHCRTCRDREGGRALRASWAAAFAVPAGSPDWACPHGREWGYAGSGPTAAPERPRARTPKPVQRLKAFVVERMNVCGECEYHTDGACAEMELAGCQSCKWRARLKQPAATCPLGKWSPNHNG